MIWQKRLLLASLLLLVSCSQDEPRAPATLLAELAQCRAALADLQADRKVVESLEAERNELKAELARVTQELVVVKVERDKHAVELKAYQRRNNSANHENGVSGKNIKQR